MAEHQTRTLETQKIENAHAEGRLIYDRMSSITTVRSEAHAVESTITPAQSFLDRVLDGQ